MATMWIVEDGWNRVASQDIDTVMGEVASWFPDDGVPGDPTHDGLGMLRSAMRTRSDAQLVAAEGMLGVSVYDVDMEGAS